MLLDGNKRGDFLNKFSLDNDLSQSIVDGILKGYKEYLDLRRKAQKALKVSGAYAWVKGNHIDSSVDEICSNYDNIQSSIERAGYTWEYLQFTLKESKEKYLVIIKNSRGASMTFNGNLDSNKKENYLYEYAGINNSIIDSDLLQSVESERFVQLELSFPELEAINKNTSMKAPEGYDRFYVVTYEFDPQSKMISKIALTLPNQSKMTLVEVADLTPLIDNSVYSITDEELEIVKRDIVPEGIYSGEDQSFGYEVASEENDDLKKELN